MHDSIMNSNRGTDMQSSFARFRNGGRAAALLTALLVTLACGRSTGEDAETVAGPPPAILGVQDVAVAERADVAAGILLTGSLQPADMVTIRAQVPGTMQSVRVDRGSAVRRGQVMGTIRAAGITGQAAGARATVAAAEANLAVARQQLEAARTLQGAGAMSVIELRTAEAQFEAAQANVAAARAQAAGASESAANTVINAPITGVVSNRQVEQGEAVSPGAELFTVVNSSTLELSGQIPVERSARVAVGQAVVFTLDAAPDRQYRGTVARIDPIADPQTRQVGVYVRMPNPGGAIVGGQFATGRVVGESAPNAVVIPVGALRETGGASFVLVLEGNRVARRPVTAGTRDDARGIVSIESGLRAGERVIATPTLDLADGAAVTVPGDARAGEVLAPGATPAAAPVAGTDTSQGGR